MASFPTSVWAPATRNVGDTIGAAFFNDPDAEIIAIEDGYLNGKAPLNSSNSTVANLSVVGGSTFNGAVTFAGSFAFSTVVSAPSQPNCVVYHSTTVTLADQTVTALTFDSEDRDVGGLHSTASSPTRVTVPVGSSGTWAFVGQAHFASPAGVAALRLALRKGGSSFIGTTQLQTQGASGIGQDLQVVGMHFMDGGTYMELTAHQQQISTGTLVCGSGTRQFSNQLRAWKVW